MNVGFGPAVSTHFVKVTSTRPWTGCPAVVMAPAGGPGG